MFFSLWESDFSVFLVSGHLLLFLPFPNNGDKSYNVAGVHSQAQFSQDNKDNERNYKEMWVNWWGNLWP